MTGFELHLEYEEIPLPRERDFVLMDKFRELTQGDKSHMMALSRVRVSLGAVFFSDVVTADGKYVEQHATEMGENEIVRSSYHFPREEPSKKDWELWVSYMRLLTGCNFELLTPLGAWKNPTHREWEWILDEGGTRLYRRKKKGWTMYVKQNDSWVDEGNTLVQPEGLVASVKLSASGKVAVRSSASMTREREKKHDSFWDFLDERGGGWMWENVTQETRAGDYTWIKEGMASGSLVWCADGSYNRKKAPDVSGVGWVVECSVAGKSLSGSFYEISDDANAYRAEQLGMCALHHLVSAVSLFFHGETWKTKVGGDNEGAIKITRRRLRRVRAGMKCADILRNVRSTRNSMTTDPNYYHVYGHMDDYLSEDKLSLEQRINKLCDELAKEAVDLACRLRVQGTERAVTQLLPGESAAVLVNGVKITGDLGDAIRYAKGYEEAREFLTKQKGWSDEQFLAVDWKSLHMTLKGKPDAYRTWLSKQHSGFCGTRVQVSHYSGVDGTDVGCPNCGCVEKASHLCVCMNPDRTKLLGEMNDSLAAWMHKGGKTDPEIAYWVPKYVQSRGSVRFQDLGSMSPSMRLLAKEQDLIGWRNFMEGRMSRSFYIVQMDHLADASGHMNGRDWMKTFIGKVLQMTHSQWIYRNVTLHDKVEGSLRRQKMEAMKSEAELLACSDPLTLPEESRFLLEMDGDRYVRGDCNFHDKAYWLSAMRAAVAAGRRVVRRARSLRVRSKELENERREAVRKEGRKVVAQIRKDFNDVEAFPFTAVRDSSGKRVVSCDATMMRIMRGNKRFKPGD